MKSTDSELQAIRHKLEQVRQAPPQKDALSLPLDTESAAKGPPAERLAQATMRPKLHKYAATVEALKQRSHQQLKALGQDFPSVSATAAISDEASFNRVSTPLASAPQSSAPAESASTAMWDAIAPRQQPSQDDWNAQLERLADYAASLNHLSAQQADIMAAMKAIADQAAIGYELNFEGWDSDGLTGYGSDGLAESGGLPALCNFEAAAVPIAQQHPLGTYVVTLQSVNLGPSSVQMARDVATELRDRGRVDFSDRSMFSGRWTDIDAWIRAGQQSYRTFLGWLQATLGQGRRATRRTQERSGTAPAPFSQPFVDSPSRAGSSQNWSELARSVRQRFQLSPLDALIWFSCGVIGRLGLNFAVVSAPSLAPYLTILIFGMGAFGLYQVSLAPRPNYSLGLKLLIFIGGLVVGGRF